MKKLNIIKQVDAFGYEVKLNFKKNKSNYNTHIGGFFTIIIYMFMIIYILINCKKLFDRAENMTTS